MTRDEIIKLAGHRQVPEWVIKLVADAVAAERSNWPAEMEAMERQVNILTDELSKAVTAEREACAQIVNDDRGLSDDDAIRVCRAIRARGQL